MLINKKTLNKPKHVVYDELSKSDNLKKLFGNSKSNDFNNIHKFDVNIQDKTPEKRIVGIIKYFDDDSEEYKVLFEVTIESKKTAIPQTEVNLAISNEPFEFTPQYEKQLQKQTKNNYKYAAIAVIALVAIMIPSGITINDHIQGSNITISETEGLLYLSQQANHDDNPNDAKYYAEKILYEQGNVDAAVQLREAYQNLEGYDSLLPAQKSLITIDSSSSYGTVMFYPDKTKNGYVIPKQNDSIQLDYPGTIPVVYPVNGQYPAVIFDKSNLHTIPIILNPTDPNYSETLSQAENSQDKVVVQPTVRVDHTENNITYAESPLGSANDPIVIYPHGFGNDVPVVVFPNQESSTTTVISGNNNYDESQQNLAQGDYYQSYLLDGTDKTTIVTSADLIPIQYTEIKSNDDDIGTTQNSNADIIPVTMSPDHQTNNNQSVEFPFGIDSSRPVINVSANVGTTITSSSSSNTGTITFGTTSSNPTFVVALQNSSRGFGGDSLNDNDGNLNSNIGYAAQNTAGGFVTAMIFGGDPNQILDELELNLDDLVIPDPLLLAWSMENYESMSLIIAQGDPNIFTINDTIEPCTIKMHPDQDDSYHWKFDLFVTGIPMKMDRTLCDGTYMMFIDFNSNGILDNGYEALWHTDYTTYQIMHIIDFENENNGNGKIDITDEIWKDVMIMDSDYKTYLPEEFGITGFNYINEINLGNDHYGPGIYSDCLYEEEYLYPNCKPVSETHFRVISWNPSGLMFDDGSVKPTYGALQGPLLDCTIYDARYMIAEKQLSEWNLDEAMRLYEEGLAYCNSMEFTSEDPDKLLSHWIAGKASYYHRDGQLEEAKPLYEEALKMSPDRHFYLTDYALLLDQLGYDDSATLPIVEKALEIDPDHGYAHTVKDRILSK